MLPCTSAEWICTLVPYLAILLMKACPSQVVMAHTQIAPTVANVFAVGYSIVKLQRRIFHKFLFAENFALHLMED